MTWHYIALHYTHAYIHTYMNACIHAYMHTYIHTYINLEKRNGVSEK